jgi:hypothetical protein
MANNIGIPEFLRPWRPIDDVNQIFGYGSRADQVGKLDDYAFGLGLSGKTGHGSQVQGMFNEAVLGKPEVWQEIADYCAMDVTITAEVLRRFLKPYTPSSGANLDSGASKDIPLAEIPFGSSQPSGGPISDLPFEQEA